MIVKVCKMNPNRTLKSETVLDALSVSEQLHDTAACPKGQVVIISPDMKVTRVQSAKRVLVLVVEDEQ